MCDFSLRDGLTVLLAVQGRLLAVVSWMMEQENGGRAVKQTLENKPKYDDTERRLEIAIHNNTDTVEACLTRRIAVPSDFTWCYFGL
jgi:DNA-binding transcriptional regulator/RsmH inhibitor MraZ